MLIGAWLASGFYVVIYAMRSGAMLEMHAGRVLITVPGAGPSIAMFPAGWHAMRNSGRLWPPPFHTEVMPLIGRRTAVALWPLALLAIATTAAAWLLEAHGRARLNLCASCRYDRAGLAADAVCPECGAAAPQDATAR